MYNDYSYFGYIFDGDTDELWLMHKLTGYRLIYLPTTFELLVTHRSNTTLHKFDYG